MTYLSPITLTEIAANTTDVVGVAAAAGLRLVGFSARETAAGNADFILRHGADATGTPIAFVRLAASEAKLEWLSDQGLPCASGIFVERLNGTTHLSLWTRVAS